LLTRSKGLRDFYRFTLDKEKAAFPSETAVTIINQSFFMIDDRTKTS
jgi:hypothetical protein